MRPRLTRQTSPSRGVSDCRRCECQPTPVPRQASRLPRLGPATSDRTSYWRPSWVPSSLTWPATASHSTEAVQDTAAIDTVHPSVVSFTTDHQSGDHIKAGETVAITATMSEAVQAGGQITVNLSSGGSAVLTADEGGRNAFGYLHGPRWTQRRHPVGRHDRAE